MVDLPKTKCPFYDGKKDKCMVEFKDEVTNHNLKAQDKLPVIRECIHDKQEDGCDLLDKIYWIAVARKAGFDV